MVLRGGQNPSRPKDYGSQVSSVSAPLGVRSSVSAARFPLRSAPLGVRSSVCAARFPLRGELPVRSAPGGVEDRASDAGRRHGRLGRGRERGREYTQQSRIVGGERGGPAARWAAGTVQDRELHLFVSGDTADTDRRMAQWLSGGEELVGEGEGHGGCTPRFQGLRSPRPGRGRGLVALGSPRERALWAGGRKQETLEKARELFQLCDKEEKGFITKRDMQRLQSELPLSPEQLESVFNSLDRDANGYLTPLEFSMGLGQFLGVDTGGLCEGGVREEAGSEWGGAPAETPVTPDPAELKLSQILKELGGGSIFKNEAGLQSLWAGLREERPELLIGLQELLSRVSAHILDLRREKDSLESALRRRECDHEQEVHSLYEEMENQIREEREKRQSQDSVRHSDRSQQLERELRRREQELESIAARQRELESEVHALSAQQADMRVQNERLRVLNTELREQLEWSRCELERAQSLIHSTEQHTLQQHREKERDVLKVSKNMQREKESLMRQLELLREMNRKLKDEKDVRQAQQSAIHPTKPLLKKGSVIGNYLLEDKPIKRQLNSLDLTSQASEEVTSEPNRKKYASNERGDDGDGQPDEGEQKLRQEGAGTEQEEDVGVKGSPRGQPEGTKGAPQRVFKVVFLGSSGVGKSSIIQRYCSSSFNPHTSATVGLDFQVRNVMVDSTPVALQLWDTAGQERFLSVTRQYLRRADGVLAVYDVTSHSSFCAVRHWISCVQEGLAEGAVLFLLGNKTDMVAQREGERGREREVAARDGRRLAEEFQAVFYECSAKSGFNIEESMTNLARLLAEQQDREVDSALCLARENDYKKSCCK
ncbi:EF-hand calcium-binding domain-containing protein 4A [Amia ocellicauda]|uniref:EF-hand calcium-binding domain-containing protein 4A n=1 Tax=Amia ocellicauda TaxID=2972642 RepID=UPI003464158E